MTYGWKMVSARLLGTGAGLFETLVGAECGWPQAGFRSTRAGLAVMPQPLDPDLGSADTRRAACSSRSGGVVMMTRPQSKVGPCWVSNHGLAQSILRTAFCNSEWRSLPLVHQPLQTHRHSVLTPSHPRKPPMDEAVWALGFPHDAPDESFNVPAALMAMRLHAGCPDSCLRKTAAAQALREAGYSESMGIR